MAEIINFKIPYMATIEETALIMEETAKKRGRKNYFTEYRIRQLAKNGQIVTVPCGNKKYLINVDKLIEFLNTGKIFKSETEPETNSKYKTISKIKVRGV